MSAKPTKTIVRIEGPDFVAGLVLDGDVCTSATGPHAVELLGKRRAWLRQYIKDNQLKATLSDER